MPGGSVMSMRPCSAPRPRKRIREFPSRVRAKRWTASCASGVSNSSTQVSVSRSIAAGEQVAEALVEHPLRARDGGRGGGVEGARPLGDRGVEVVGGTSALKKPWRSIQRGVLERAGEQQLARGALAEHLGQQQRAGVGGAEADPHLGRGEAGAVGADAQVAGGGELERAADADAVDRGDHGHGGVEHDAREALELVDRGGEARGVGRRRPRTGRRRRRSPRRRRARRGSGRRGRGRPASSGVGDRGDRRAAPGVAVALVVPADHARAAELLGGHGHGCGSSCVV